MHENGTVEQVVHYYPFGGTYADAGVNRSLQMYKYNGRELLAPCINLQLLIRNIQQSVDDGLFCK